MAEGKWCATGVQVVLPMCLFCQLVSPQQTAAYKLTLDTNRPPPPLAELFQDMVAQAQVSHCAHCKKTTACCELVLHMSLLWHAARLCCYPVESTLLACSAKATT